MCFKVPAWLYLILNTFVSSLISGAIDAGLTAAIYHPDIYKDVRVFEWSNTLAGNILLTTIIQGTLTWFLCHTLIRNGQRAKVLGIGHFPRPACCDSTIPMIFFQSEDLLRCPPKKGCNWPGIGGLFLSILKSFCRGLLFGFTMVWLIGWPVTLIMYGIGTTSIDGSYDYWWLIVFMGVYGFCYGVVIAIPITVIALMSPKEDDEDEMAENDEEAPVTASVEKERVPSSEEESSTRSD